jgi:hypothetical protein
MLELNEENLRKVTMIRFDALRHKTVFCTPPETDQKFHINMAGAVGRKSPADDHLSVASFGDLEVLIRILEIFLKKKFVPLKTTHFDTLIFVREDRKKELHPERVH